MTFDHPVFLLLLLLLPLDLALSLARRGRREAVARTLFPPSRREAGARRRGRAGLLALVPGSIFIITTSFALAGPAWGTRAERVDRSGLEVALVIDVSRSMEVADSGGVTRLEAAKSLARLLVGEGTGDAFSLVVAKGEGLLLVPMTEDLDAVESALDYADPSVMSRAGTDLGSGIETALASFSPIASPGRVILLLSDGGDQGRSARSAAVDARSRSVRILSVGFGGVDPAIVPGPDGRPLGAGVASPVKSALEPELLRALALASGGLYFDANEGGSLAGIRAELAHEGRTGTRTVLRLRERASVFAILALAALIARFALELFAIRPPRGAGRGRAA